MLRGAILGHRRHDFGWNPAHVFENDIRDVASPNRWGGLQGVRQHLPDVFLGGDALCLRLSGKRRLLVGWKVDDQAHWKHPAFNRINCRTGEPGDGYFARSRALPHWFACKGRGSGANSSLPPRGAVCAPRLRSGAWFSSSMPRTAALPGGTPVTAPYHCATGLSRW